MASLWELRSLITPQKDAEYYSLLIHTYVPTSEIVLAERGLGSRAIVFQTIWALDYIPKHVPAWLFPVSLLHMGLCANIFMSEFEQHQKTWFLE